MIETVSLGLERIMTQQAILQRDQATKDAYGAKVTADWQPLSNVACFMWWGTGAVITRMGSIHNRPEELIDEQTGGLVLPEGTDVTARDRILQILDADGNVIEHGPFEILSVGAFEGTTELLVRRLT